MSRFLRWAQTEHSVGTRITATLLAGVIVAILFPYLLVVICPSIDQQLGLHPLNTGVASYVLGCGLIAVGLIFALWSVLAQLTRGRGTPLPMLPTQELLTTGPFRYCRNPMTFGTILAYLGMSISTATIVGVALALCFAALLLLYLKRVEEKELAERFGEAYVAYKRKVPFIIPKSPRRN
jgi:protein-S-isoprenylcysteine O-methyltransferase Ste14